jgi:ribosomal protein S27AE
MSCNICVEPLNKSKRSEVKCDLCEFSACKLCWKQFLLESTRDAACMSCKKEWTRAVLVGKLGQSFVNTEYKRHRENVLMDREHGRLLEAMPYAEREILTKRVNDERRERENQGMSDEEIEKELEPLQKRISELYAEINRMRPILPVQPVQEPKPARKFVRKCPVNECRGFLTSDWKCGLCNNETCKKCSEIKQTKKQHTCDPNNVETTKLLAKDTKPCPKCGSGIFRISGCNQMFCTECHTTFDWKTGEIDKGVVHNPHYFEYIRRTGRQPQNEVQDWNCREGLTNNFLNGLHHKMARHGVLQSLKLPKHKSAAEYDLYSIGRALLHIDFVIFKLRFNFLKDRGTMYTLDLRKDYLLKRISETEFKVRLQQREKEFIKKTETIQVFEMFFTCATDIMYRFYDVTPDTKEMKILFNELQQLREYANEQFIAIGKVFKSKVYNIDQSFKVS